MQFLCSKSEGWLPPASSSTVHGDQVHCFVQRPYWIPKIYPQHICLHIYQLVCEEKIVKLNDLLWLFWYYCMFCHSHIAGLSWMSIRWTCWHMIIVLNWCKLNFWPKTRWGIYIYTVWIYGVSLLETVKLLRLEVSLFLFFFSCHINLRKGFHREKVL